ncbi:MAG: peptidylprolyl isomerase [Candidatus Omnitrophica bacterium]|nr:peptidylprolyl isomerase [Candidatus Omnitrophota bacterium]
MKTRILIITLIAAVVFTGCARKPAPEDKVLVTVSNRTMTLRDFNDRIDRLPDYYKRVVERNKKRFLEEMIAEMLFYEEGVRKGLDRDKEVQDILREAKKKVVITKLIKNEVEDKTKVTDDQMKRFYETHKESFKSPELWRASHILVGTEQEAKDISDQLAGGASFEELAKKYSTDATAERGGDVGYFRKGQLVPDFEKACLKLDVGQASDVVRTQFGYHIIKLTDKKEPQVQPFESVKRIIEGELKKVRQSELLDELVMKLKDRYKVQINNDTLQALEGPAKESAAQEVPAAPERPAAVEEVPEAPEGAANEEEAAVK